MSISVINNMIALVILVVVLLVMHNDYELFGVRMSADIPV